MSFLLPFSFTTLKIAGRGTRERVFMMMENCERDTTQIQVALSEDNGRQTGGGI
jgi:hypothetical protein